MGDFTTKDSGVRQTYESGMVRDAEEGKARFDLLLPLGVPYSEQMLTRFAELMARGAKKYDARNWEKANGEEELSRYRSSALRHLIQWVSGEDDEDHAAAVMFNLMAGETVLLKMRAQARVDIANDMLAEACVEYHPWNPAQIPEPFPGACGNCGAPRATHDLSNGYGILPTPGKVIFKP